MISAAFIWEPGTYDTEFNELNALIEEAAVSTPGFIGVESWTSDDGKRNNATYYWSSLESLQMLSVHPKHIEAKRRYAEWYNGYHVVISEVIRSYGDGAFAHLTPRGKNAAQPVSQADAELASVWPTLMPNAARLNNQGHAMTDHPLEVWHRLVREHDPSGLSALLAEDAVFHSPVVHTPQRGRKLAVGYLSAAFQVFFNPTFRYVREIVGTSDAMLEFETEIDGILVNGIDLIKWNSDGQIVDFKVMIRPLKAINLIHQRMAAMLQTSR